MGFAKDGAAARSEARSELDAELEKLRVERGKAMVASEEAREALELAEAKEKARKARKSLNKESEERLKKDDFCGYRVFSGFLSVHEEPELAINSVRCFEVKLQQMVCHGLPGHQRM